MDFCSLVLITLLVQIVQLHGQDGPKVAPFSSLVKPVIGGKTSFICLSLSGSPPYQIVWMKDGKQVYDSPDIRVGSVQESSVLLIDSIQSSHSGNYTCKISNKHGSDSYTAELAVEGPPNWIKKPNNVKSAIHQIVNVKCLVSGYPKPTITWKKLQESSWVQLDVQFDGDLRIMNTTKNHGGKYGCLASNGIQPDLWSEVDISIEEWLFYSDKSTSFFMDLCQSTSCLEFCYSKE